MYYYSELFAEFMKWIRILIYLYENLSESYEINSKNIRFSQIVQKIYNIDLIEIILKINLFVSYLE